VSLARGADAEMPLATNRVLPHTSPARFARRTTTMMTLAFALLAANGLLLWRRQARWGPALTVAALVIGIVILVQDVDFGADLGIQL